MNHSHSFFELDGARLTASPPICRYLSEDDSSADQGSPGSWSVDADGIWRWSDDRLTLEARAQPRDGGLQLSLTLAAGLPTVVQSFVANLECEAPQAPFFLDRQLRWRRLTKTSSISELTPLVVRYVAASGSTMELRTVGSGAACRLSWDAGRLKVGVIMDAAALHPRVQFPGGAHSVAAARWDVGHSATLHFTLRRESQPPSVAPMVPARFPAGAEATFVITDHPDFDYTEGLEVLLEGRHGRPGWTGRGLKLSKGTFHFPSQPPDWAPAPSLAEPDYLRLISALAADGSEIVPHALSQWGTVSPQDFRQGLTDFVTRWHPRTWIDHGMTISYCYTMGGATNPQYRLLDQLRDHGITNLWSYCDVASDPVASLNLIEAPAEDGSLVLSATARHLQHGAWPVALHYVRCLLDTRMRGQRGNLVRNVMSAVRRLGMQLHQTGRIRADDLRAVIQVLQEPLKRGLAISGTPPEQYERPEALEMAPTFYPERPAPLGQVRRDDMLMFTTNQIVHIRDAYTPANLEALTNERGIHVGHIYLLSHKPYVAGLFESENRGTPSSAWLTFVDALAESVAAGRLWNPIVSDVADWFRNIQKVEVAPIGDRAVELVNRSGTVLRDYTVLLPPDRAEASIRWGVGRPVGTRHWTDWIAVWGDLPPDVPVRVRWQ